MSVKSRVVKLEERHRIRRALPADHRNWTDEELENRIREVTAQLAPPGYILPDLSTDEGLRQIIADADRFGVEEHA